MMANVQQDEVEEEHPESVGSDFDDLEDDFMDEESEKIMRSLKEQRLAYAQADYEEQ